jgi:amidase
MKAESNPLSPASLSRRSFVGGFGKKGLITALGGGAALTGGARSLKASAPSSFPVSKDPETDLLKMSATKVAGLIRSRQVTSLEVTQACIDRIQKVNPLLNAVVTPCFERALMEARTADRELAAGRIKGALHGVPMTIKDSLDTAGVVTTGGTQGRSHFVPEKDATAIARLREAGAILLGKTNTPELTLGGVAGLGTTSNIIFGMSRNPYDTRYSTSGSSGGAGAIVAAYGSYLDIGTDFGGSVRGPAHANGIAGLKPTSCRTPRTGHIVDYGGIFDSYQQLGPMVRRTEDIDLIMPIICGPDYIDAAVADVPLGDPSTVELKGMRVAWFTSNGPDTIKSTPETIDAVMRSVKYFESLGCKIAEDRPPEIIEIMQLSSRLREGDGNAWQKRALDSFGTTVPGPARRFDFPLIPTSEMTKLLEERDHWRSRMLQWMDNYDLIISPVTWSPANKIGSPFTGWSRGGSFNGVHNLSGYPAGTVRVGWSPEGLPIGVQVAGKPWADHTVQAALTALESFSGGYVAPKI